MTPNAQGALGLVGLMLLVSSGSFACAWQVQDWRHGKQLADQDAQYQREKIALSNAASAQAKEQRDKRLALELRLQIKDKTHHQELTDEYTRQARLRDRLATADLRLSVLLAGTGNNGSMPATTATGRVVHDATRAQLDPAHAQRIIGITDDGDQGLIALRACQAYAREVSTPQ